MSMDEQKEAQDFAAKPFETAEPGRSNLVVEPQTGGDLSGPSFVCALATVPTEESQPIPEDKITPLPPPPHAASISNIAKAEAKVSLKNAKSVKKPMAPQHFFGFVIGLFVAGVAGSFCNGIITAQTDAFFAPQYVKDFHQYEAFSDRDRAFAGMRRALAEGETLEPQSRRFTYLTASFAERLDNTASYLAAKKQWARAAVPSDSAPPELRELKRSFLIDEAESEHLAFLSEVKEDVDASLLKEVESAGRVFQSSGVAHHGWRAFRAYIAAGALAADAKEFSRSHENFDRAQSIANSQFQNDMSADEMIVEAKWRAELQETLAGLLALKYKPILSSQFTGTEKLSDFMLSSHDLKAHQYDKIELAFAKAQKEHRQDIFGNSIATGNYLTLGQSWGRSETNSSRRELIKDWAASRSDSARPLIAFAYSFNADAERATHTIFNRPISPIKRLETYENLYEAARSMRLALALEPQVAYEPAFIEAIQRNLRTEGKLSGYSYLPSRLVSDLHSADIAMTVDEAQFFLDDISYNASQHAHTSEFVRSLLVSAEAQANKIGSDAGDKFYTRAVWRIGASRTFENVDKVRFQKGRSLIRAKFGEFPEMRSEIRKKNPSSALD